MSGLLTAKYSVMLAPIHEGLVARAFLASPPPPDCLGGKGRVRCLGGESGF